MAMWIEADGFLCPKCGRQAYWVCEYRYGAGGRMEAYRRPLQAVRDAPLGPNDEELRETVGSGYEVRVRTRWRHAFTLECHRPGCDWLGDELTAARGRPSDGANGVQTALWGEDAAAARISS